LRVTVMASTAYHISAIEVTATLPSPQFGVHVAAHER